VVVGDFLTHNLTVLNYGSAATSGVRVHLPLPPGHSFFMAADLDSAGFTCTWAANTATCAGGILSSGGSARIQVLTRVTTCPALSPLAITAVADPFGTIPESNEGNNTATSFTTVIGCLQAPVTATPTTSITPAPTRTATPTVALVPGQVDLAVGMSAVSNPAVSGVYVTYTITIANHGTDPATGITLRDVLPGGQSFVLATDQDSNGFLCQEAPVGTVTCSGGSLAGGASGRLTVVGLAQGCPPAPPFGNNVTVDPNNTIAEANEANNTAFTLELTCPTPTSTAPAVVEPTSTVTQPTATATATATGTALAPTATPLGPAAPPTNIAPVLSATDRSLIVYVEKASPLTILATLSVTDADSANLVGATVQIAGGLQSNQDVLGFVNQSGITGSYNALSGMLTLTGNSSVASYEAALRSVTYANTSDVPNTTVRVIHYQVNDGAALNSSSNILDRQVGVTPVNDAPVLANIEAGGLTYAAGDPAIVVTSTITVSDADSSTISSASVSITSGFQSGADVLGFTNQNGICGSYASGVLTLTGTSSLPNYQNALRSVTYQNTSGTPAGGTRTVSFLVNDGAPSNAVGNVLGRNIVLPSVPVNQAPVITAPSIVVYPGNVFVFTGPDRISISDVDAGAGSLRVGLFQAPSPPFPPPAPLTLSGTAGLTFITGSNGGPDMEFEGTLPDINNALDGLRYDCLGTLLLITVDDNGNTGSGGPQQDAVFVSLNSSDVFPAPDGTVRSLGCGRR